MSDKPKFPAPDAMRVAEELIAVLKPACLRICFAGSLRRRKAEVSDVEILYIPRIEQRPDHSDMFVVGTVETNVADQVIADLETIGTLERRKNIRGSTMFGQHNKLMRHRESGIPVDLFSATLESWWNYLVCRTGPAELNIAICNAAIAKGWRWEPYSAGFRRIGYTQPMHSEAEVFEFVGMPYRAPEQRSMPL